jgi:hypothetical protein
MAVKRRTSVEYYCKQCRGNREMKRAGKGLDGEITWLKCTDCGKMTFISQEEWDTLLAGDREVEIEAEVPYDPNARFAVGQALYHKVWDDRGEVVKKEVTSGGQHMIVVSFDRLGERRLVENLGSV